MLNKILPLITMAVIEALTYLSVCNYTAIPSSHTCDEAEEGLNVGSILEVRATQTVPDDVGHFLHQFPARHSSRPAVLRQVHRTSDLGREALVQGRQHPQLHRGEAGVGAVRLQRFEPDPGNVYWYDPVYGQEMLDKSQH